TPDHTGLQTTDHEGPRNGNELTTGGPRRINHQGQRAVVQWAAQHYRIGAVTLERLTQPGKAFLALKAQFLGIQDPAYSVGPSIRKSGMLQGAKSMLSPADQQRPGCARSDRPQLEYSLVDQVTLGNQSETYQTRQQDEARQ